MPSTGACCAKIKIDTEVKVTSFRRKIEPRCEKTGFLAYAKTKTQISWAVTAQLISAFVFALRIVQSLFLLNPKFQASSHLLLLYSLVCVRLGQKPRRPVFSQRGSIYIFPISVHNLCFGADKRKMSHVMRKPTFWFPTRSDYSYRRWLEA